MTYALRFQKIAVLALSLANAFCFILGLFSRGVANSRRSLAFNIHHPKRFHGRSFLSKIGNAVSAFSRMSKSMPLRAFAS